MEFTEKTLDKCLRAGADSAEVFSLNQKTLSLTVRDGKLETIQKSTPGGLAVRFFKDRKTSFAHTTDLSDKSVSNLIDTAKNMASRTETDEFALLPRPGQYGRDLEIYDDSRTEVPTEEKIEFLAGLERQAMDYDVLVTGSNGASCREVLSEIDIMNSNGMESNFKTSLYSLGISVLVTKNGNMFPGEGRVSARFFNDLPDPAKIVDMYTAKAVRLVGGTPVSGGDYEIIFAPDAATSILWGLSFALNGDNALKGLSFLAGKEEQKFADGRFSVIDDAVRIRGIASRPSDHEGVPSQDIKLVDNGILTGFLYDTRTGAKAGKKSTGSSIKADFDSIPSISPSNFYIAPGEDKVEDVIASCKKGIIVESINGWALNGVSGQYSAGINGILVRNGKRIRPVANVTIAAGPEVFFGGIDAVCDDITFYDDFSSPTIKIRKMKVGG